jgi:hypothetical protein
LTIQYPVYGHTKHVTILYKVLTRIGWPRALISVLLPISVTFSSIFAYFFVLKMDATRSSEKLISVYESTRRWLLTCILGGAWFESRPRHWLSSLRFFIVVLSSSTQIPGLQLLPSKAFPVHPSSLILPFKAILSEILTASLNKSQKNTRNYIPEDGNCNNAVRTSDLIHTNSFKK